MKNQQDTVPIAILPMGDVSRFEIKMVAKIIRDEFHIIPAQLQSVSIPTYFYNVQEMKWNAHYLLDYMLDFLAKNTARIIGVFDEDMYAEGLDFVYGYARLYEGTAIISTARLKEEWYGLPGNARKLYNRVLRITVHELGHTFALPHCENDCVMHAIKGDDTSYVDSHNKNFCGPCDDKMQYLKQISPLSPIGLYGRAQALMGHGKDGEAARIFTELLGTNSLNAYYHAGLGRALFDCNNFKEARTALSRALELGLRTSAIYYYMAMIDGVGYGAQAAEKWFEQAIEMDSDKLGAHKHVATIYNLNLNNADLARKHCLEYFRLGGDDPEMKMMAASLGLMVI